MNPKNAPALRRTWFPTLRAHRFGSAVIRNRLNDEPLCKKIKQVAGRFCMVTV